MPLKTIHLTIDKPEKELYVTNITAHVNSEIKKSKVTDGTVVVFIPGSTAAVTTIEYEPNLLSDLDNMLEKMIPSNIDYEHSKTWGETNGKSHLRASIFGPSVSVPLIGGKMSLGEWQHLVVMDFDVRTRKRDIIIQIIS